MTNTISRELDAALESLFTAPFPDFVVERKRLVAELRAAGHRADASALGKVNRPTLASWAINQLVRRAPAEIAAMFATAARVRLGDFAATAAHRQTVARLGALATSLLSEHGQPTSEATLRRIATTLQALSAYGDFGSDTPGRMIADRDPPGFEAMSLDGLAAAAPLGEVGSLPAAQRNDVVAMMAPATAARTAEARPTAGAVRSAAADGAAASGDTAQGDAANATAAALISGSAAAHGAPAAEPQGGAKPRAAVVADARRDSATAAPRADARNDAELGLAIDKQSADDASEATAAAAVAQAAAAAAAQAAAARVQLARQRAVLEELRTRQRRLASAIYEHEQALAVLQKELQQRQTRLQSSRQEAALVEQEIMRISATLGAPVE